MNYLLFNQKHKEKSRNTFFYFLFSILFVSFSYSQETIKDTTQLDEVLVKAVRVNKETPVSFSNLKKKKLKTAIWVKIFLFC
jgi:iron complex outermembrane receptor protein